MSQQNEIAGVAEVQGRIGHHVLMAGYLALFGHIDGAESEMQQAIELSKSINP